jgi:hypothetical protein
MKLTSEINYTVPQAIREAIDILEEEANQLAGLQHKPEIYEKLSHRVHIAISREISRLRAIATTLKP